MLVLEDIASGPYYLQGLICCSYLINYYVTKEFFLRNSEIIITPKIDESFFKLRYSLFGIAGGQEVDHNFS